ncbi:MAG TPA: hypothetical protein VFQ46_05800 [Candidatus Limnocylindria bacterium]|nr:hypothetical protein [Candidatus Limnocylindria bacterium]
MTRLRLFVWLVALMALIAPPGMSAHAMMPAAEASSVDCADHAPPPDPCPDEGTAKHAASACCPLMSGAVALLPPPTEVETPVLFDVHLSLLVRSLVGRIFTKDPPPPRV